MKTSAQTPHRRSQARAPRVYLGSLRILLRQPRHDPHRLQAHADHLPDEPHDVLFVAGPVRVGADAAALALFDLILIDDPLQGAAVAEAGWVGLGRVAGEGEG